MALTKLSGSGANAASRPICRGNVIGGVVHTAYIQGRDRVLLVPVQTGKIFRGHVIYSMMEAKLCTTQAMNCQNRQMP